MDVKTSITAYIDIETLPTRDSLAIAAIADEIEPPKKMSRPETIAAWVKEDKPLAIAKAIQETALDGTYGCILAIGCAIDDGPVKVWIGADEAKLLREFFAAVSALEIVNYDGAAEYHCEVTWVGHNVRNFDLRFLWQRAVINGIRMPRSMLDAALSRSWEKLVQDTMMLWNPERDRRISMDKLCKALGVPSPKGDMDGSMVATAWLAGQRDRIEAYSKAEVEALRSCYKRMVFASAA